MNNELYLHLKMGQTHFHKQMFSFSFFFTKSTVLIYLFQKPICSVFVPFHFSHLCQNITSSLTPTPSAPMLSHFLNFFLWGDKLARQRAVESLLRSKQDARLSGKIHRQELPRLSVLLPISALRSNSPSGQRSAPIASTWLVPSRNSYGAMSHSLTPFQILTV